jgi:hypothetical protein
MPPEEVIRVLESMSFFQKRALKKAGFKPDGLHRLAGTEYGAGLVEAVLACHTDLLGRQPRADEPEKAAAAQRHPGVSAASSSGTSADVSASGRGRLNIDPELRAMMEAQKKEKKQAKKDQRARPDGERKLP